MKSSMKPFAFLVLAAFAFAGCVKEKLFQSDEDRQIEVTADGVVFSAGWESNLTKTTLTDGEGSAKLVNWEAGDSIKIMSFNAAGEMIVTKATAVSAGRTTTFVASVPEADIYYAVYPYSTDVTIDETGKMTVVPPTQDGSFQNANICVAKTTAAARNFIFKNMFAIVKFTTASDKIGRIDITDLARAYTISGSVEATFDEQNNLSLNYLDGTYFYRKELPTGNQTHYVAVRPGTYEQGLAFVFESGDVMMPAYVVKKPVELTRTDILNCGEVDTKAGKNIYVSVAGSGDGLSASNPMSFESWLGIVSYKCPEGESDYFEKSLSVAGHTYNFEPGTYTFPSDLNTLFSNPYGSFNSTGVPFEIKGGDGVVFTGQRFTINSFARVIISDVTFSGFTFGTGAALSVQTIRSVTFRHCVFENNHAYSNAGALHVSGGKVILEDCIFQNNEAEGVGGAIYANARTSGESTIESDLTISNCSFLNNSATGSYGGAVVLEKGTAVISDCQFKGNSSATNAGALRNKGVMTVTNCVFEDNIANGKGTSDQAGTGGAMYIGEDDSKTVVTECVFKNNRVGETNGTNGGAVNIQAKLLTAEFVDCTFESNTATTTGGAIQVNGSQPQVTISGGTFKANKAGTNGGAIYGQTDSHTTVSGAKFIENNAVNGGAYCSYGYSTLSGCEFTGNYAETGGAIRNYKARYELTDCTFVDNYSTKNSGGALYVGDDNASLVMSGCVFNNNSSNTTGGAINFQDKSITANISGCSFIGNTAKSHSGCFQIAGGSGTYSFDNCSFKNNAAGTGSNGGVCYATNASVKMNACTMEGNTAKQGGAFYCGTGKLYMNSCVLKNNINTANGASTANEIVITSGSGYLGMNNCTVYTSSSVETGDASVKLGGTSGPNAAICNCTFVSDCSNESYTVLACPYTAAAGGLDNMVIMSNIIKSTGSTTAVGGYLKSSGYNLFNSGEFNSANETDGTTVPELTASPSSADLTHFLWDGACTNKATAEQISAAIALSHSSYGQVFVQFLESKDGLAKDQLGNDRNAEAFTPGSVQF